MAEAVTPEKYGWQPGGTLYTFPEDINNRVVGASDLLGDTTSHAFLWTTGMQDLGTLAGDSTNLAKGINKDDQVVGQSCDTSGNCRAFLWQDGVMIDLNTLVSGGGSTLFLFEAFDINSREQFVAIGFNTTINEVHAFLATPSNHEVDGASAPSAALKRDQRKTEGQSP
jgi:probable HAF family extracellular repeat protein